MASIKVHRRPWMPRAIFNSGDEHRSTVVRVSLGRRSWTFGFDRTRNEWRRP